MSLVVYGMSCTWWDDIDNVAVHSTKEMKGPGLPCCPYCHSMLLEMEDDEWWTGVNAHAHRRVENYGKYILWLKGKCFKKMEYAIDMYLKEHQG